MPEADQDEWRDQAPTMEGAQPSGNAPAPGEDRPAIPAPASTGPSHGVAGGSARPASRGPVATIVRVLDRVTGRAHDAILVGILVIGLAVVTGMAFLSGEVYESVKQGNGLALIDGPALHLSVATRNPFSDTLVTAFTDLAGVVGMSIIATIATALLVWRQRSWTPAVLMVFAVAGSLTLTVAGKDLVGRARPPLADAVPPYESSPSFPSGHTLNSTVIAGVLAYLVARASNELAVRVSAILIAIAWAGSVGLSRVWLGHHWLTDVAAGWTLGAMWVAVVITAHQAWLRVRSRPRPRPALA
ncbi:MAG: phosphatase PAP2 family protein [Actinomycetales bacterium]